ncbi:chromate transporter [Mycoplasmopsis cricetuli]|uniref:chromate transporter n=1 Tax=Mycoplasmopsis cricetuli TaxID=171283 RepID=UPI00047063AB|nr:chromate transporter [Mycoplasmopsis cricetuli]
MLLVSLFTLFGVFIIGLIVFGGGQIFMPIFQSFWLFIGKTFNLNITQEQIDTIFTISNSTPGVISTKFSAFTGLLVANNQWWGWILAFISYLIFCLPAIFMMLLSVKLLKKTEHSKYLKNLIKYISPVLAAILIALAIQLLISRLVPSLVFNQGIKNYLGWNSSSETAQFFKNWRFPVLIIWMIFYSALSFYLYLKKIPLFLLFIIGIVISFILFQPWFS